MVLWPVPYWLSNMCLVSVSFTAMMGYFSAPSASMALSRITPVVVSSLPPLIPSMRSGRLLWMVFTRSAPSSVV